MTRRSAREQGSKSGPCQPTATAHIGASEATQSEPDHWQDGRLVWERIYGRSLDDGELKAIEETLLRFVDLLASIAGSTLVDHEQSMSNGGEAA